MKSPVAPPPLTAMGERKATLEKTRADLFGKWKAALEASSGNITKATETFKVEGKSVAKSYGDYLTRSLGLVEYARELRVKAGHPRKAGRPWPK